MNGRGPGNQDNLWECTQDSTAFIHDPKLINWTVWVVFLPGLSLQKSQHCLAVDSLGAFSGLTSPPLKSVPPRNWHAFWRLILLALAAADSEYNQWTHQHKAWQPCVGKEPLNIFLTVVERHRNRQVVSFDFMCNTMSLAMGYLVSATKQNLN